MSQKLLLANNFSEIPEIELTHKGVWLCLKRSCKAIQDYLCLLLEHNSKL